MLREFQLWLHNAKIIKLKETRANTFLRIEHLCDCAVVLAELREQAGGDGQQITACQSLDLASVSEGGAHHHGAVAKLFVVVVNLCHAHHTCRWRDECYHQQTMPSYITDCRYVPCFTSTIHGNARKNKEDLASFYSNILK